MIRYYREIKSESVMNGIGKFGSFQYVFVFIVVEITFFCLLFFVKAFTSSGFDLKHEFLDMLSMLWFRMISFNIAMQIIFWIIFSRLKVDYKYVCILLFYMISIAISFFYIFPSTATFAKMFLPTYGGEITPGFGIFISVNFTYILLNYWPWE